MHKPHQSRASHGREVGEVSLDAEGGGSDDL